MIKLKLNKILDKEFWNENSIKSSKMISKAISKAGYSKKKNSHYLIQKNSD